MVTSTDLHASPLSFPQAHYLIIHACSCSLWDGTILHVVMLGFSLEIPSTLLQCAVCSVQCAVCSVHSLTTNFTHPHYNGQYESGQNHANMGVQTCAEVW